MMPFVFFVACSSQISSPQVSTLTLKRQCREFEDPVVCSTAAHRLEEEGKLDNAILALGPPCEKGIVGTCRHIGRLAKKVQSPITASAILGLACSANQREACEQIVLLHADRPDLVGDTILKRAQAFLAK